MKQVLLFIAALWLLASPALALDDNATRASKAGRLEGYSMEFLGPIDCCDDNDDQDCMDCPKQMGRLFYRDGVFYFEGDMDQSAELFLEYVNERAPEFCERVREQ